MVTYINAKNAEAYQLLFSKAAEVLREVHPQSISDSLEEQGLSWDNFAIGSLNEYYAYLPDIREALSKENPTPQELDALRAFVRLPLDEDTLTIDADKRSISIPTNFARYGVGVQGDEMAEVIYFVVDRYFDSTDLSSYDVNIAIQWEAKDAEKKTITGYSKNFGKELLIIDNKQKVVFGWPISSELTQTNSNIKFAVRFYSIDPVNKVFTYSFTTLPAEVSINASLDYTDDIINNPEKEIDHGSVITGRIRNSGIYDPNAEAPAEPTITTELYVQSPAGNESSKVVDLPTDGSGVTLAIGAKPTTSGIIVYDWKQYAYDQSTGGYSLIANTTGLPEGDTITVSHPLVTSDIADDAINCRYYKFNDSKGAYELVSLNNFEANEEGVYEYSVTNGGFKMNGAGYVALYKELSEATVHSVGKYAVDVSARILANTSTKVMNPEDAITIPGPVKPKIDFAEGILVSDDIAHIISSDEHRATLAAIAHKGEDGEPIEKVGENPQVTLEYDWMQKVNGVGVPVNGETAQPGPIGLSVLPSANINWSGEYGEASNEIARANQDKATLIQDGNDIVIYLNGELEAYLSSDSNQAADGPQKWLAIDIDTKEETIEGLTWNTYPIGASDVAEAASIGLGAGHIIFWARADLDRVYNIAIGKPVYNEETEEYDVETTDLHVTFSNMPSDVSYIISDNQMTILGLPDDATLDKTYFVKVTATRNGVQTSEVSGDYRITNKPEKPIIKVRKLNANNQIELVEKDYKSAVNTEPVYRFAGQSATLSFSVEPPTQSDSLSYIWMRIRVEEDVPTDMQGQSITLQADLDNAIEGLAEIIGNPEGQADYPVESSTIELARKYFENIAAIGDVADPNFEDNGPKYVLPADRAGGYFYCVVINELNGHINANVSPFFQVS